MKSVHLRAANVVTFSASGEPMLAIQLNAAHEGGQAGPLPWIDMSLGQAQALAVAIQQALLNYEDKVAAHESESTERHRV